MDVASLRLLYDAIMTPLGSYVKRRVIVFVISNPMSEQRIRLPLRISASLKAKLAVLAEREHRSLNKQIEFLLDRSVREEEKVHETGDSNRQKGEGVKRK
jgi:hypothetical protein